MNLSSFGENILQGFFGVSGLKDYTHASKHSEATTTNLLPEANIYSIVISM
jgi:hypothetical protein